MFAVGTWMVLFALILDRVYEGDSRAVIACNAATGLIGSILVAGSLTILAWTYLP